MASNHYILISIISVYLSNDTLHTQYMIVFGLSVSCVGSRSNMFGKIQKNNRNLRAKKIEKYTRISIL